MLSGAARTVVSEAQLAAYVENLVRSYAYQPEEYEETMETMRLAAIELTDLECELLAKLWRAALAAAASIDPDDLETVAGHNVYRGDLHWYYRMISGMVEEAIQERKAAEPRKKIAEEPDNPSHIPF